MDEENVASCSSDNNKDNPSCSSDSKDETEKASQQFTEGYNTFEDFMKVIFKPISRLFVVRLCL